jgi:hypothetical protein
MYGVRAAMRANRGVGSAGNQPGGGGGGLTGAAGVAGRCRVTVF